MNEVKERMLRNYEEKGREKYESKVGKNKRMREVERKEVNGLKERKFRRYKRRKEKEKC